MSGRLRRAALMAAALLFASAALARPPEAAARIVRVETIRVEPAFGGRTFGAVGAYEHVVAVAHGEVDPADPANALVQDLALAPRNARGLVEYAADVEMLRPADPGRGNGTVLHELPNRGDKYLLALTFHRDVPWGNTLTDAGDGWLLAEGYTLLWSGWQGDLIPGEGRVGLRVPVARGPNGAPIEGPVRAEFALRQRAFTLPLSYGWFTAWRHLSYPTVSRNHRAPLPDGSRPALTVRDFERDPPERVPDDAWSFGACADGRTVTPSDADVCLFAGFEPGRLYELVYRARDPLVLGLGYAAVRDLGAFLKRGPNGASGDRLWRGERPPTLVLHGVSQPARNMRTWLHLGFNADEAGRPVYDALLPHVGAGRAQLDSRFAQPGRAWGHQLDRRYPAYEFPLAYAEATDPGTGRVGSVLARCRATGTCPRVVHVVSAHELWDGRGSLVSTDPRGTRDLADPPEVRQFVLASAQHAPAWESTPGDCLYPRNPAPHRETMRALLVALTRWARDGVAPPASRLPRIADGTLVPPADVRFPAIPGVRAPGFTNGLPRLDFGPRFRPEDERGIVDLEPPRVLDAEAYTVLVPQTDGDGNDLGGVRTTTIAAPVGTYTGWNLGRSGRWPGTLCSLQGTYLPFARTRAAREAAGDPRPSLEERYGDHAGYVTAVRRAAAALVADRLLLPADAARLAAEAEASEVLR
jgi:hypothetical protein